MLYKKDERFLLFSFLLGLGNSVSIFKMLKSLFLVCFLTSFINSIDINGLNLPPEHIPYFFNSFPNIANACVEDPQCPFKALVGKEACWGYERDCDVKNSYHVRPWCPGDHRGWVKTKEAQYDTFYTQADFGKDFKNYS